VLGFLTLTTIALKSTLHQQLSGTNDRRLPAWSLTYEALWDVGYSTTFVAGAISHLLMPQLHSHTTPATGGVGALEEAKALQRARMLRLAAQGLALLFTVSYMGRRMLHSVGWWPLCEPVVRSLENERWIADTTLGTVCEQVGAWRFLKGLPVLAGQRPWCCHFVVRCNHGVHDQDQVLFTALNATVQVMLRSVLRAPRAVTALGAAKAVVYILMQVTGSFLAKAVKACMVAVLAPLVLDAHLRSMVVRLFFCRGVRRQS
jgi:hypothetical protein